MIYRLVLKSTMSMTLYYVSVYSSVNEGEGILFIKSNFLILSLVRIQRDENVMKTIIRPSN